MIRLLILVLSGLLIGGCSATPTAESTPTPNPTIEATPASNDEQSVKGSSTNGDTVNKNKETIAQYSEGMYKIGVDMPAGQYNLVANTTNKAYFAICSDANCESIVENDNFKYNSIISIEDGDYLELSRADAYPFDEYVDINTDGEGMFLVGRDIPAGEYKIETITENKGYYAILSDTRNRDIISNDNFGGSRYIEVSDGQYLELSRCRLIK